MLVSSTLTIGDGRYLASMSPYKESIANNKYAHHDIFVVTPGKTVRPITSLSAYSLSALGRAGNRLFFSAYGVSGWPRPAPLEPRNEVLSGEWNGDEEAVANVAPFKPFDGVATSCCVSNPSVAPDGSILVAQTGYERDPAIVIHNFKTGENALQKLSPYRRANAIAVTGNELTWIEIDDDRFRIIDVDARTGARRVGAELIGSNIRTRPELISIH
jgi:hypothetical protein